MQRGSEGFPVGGDASRRSVVVCHRAWQSGVDYRKKYD